MPSTREIVENVVELNHGWTAEGSKGVLPILNRINRYMISHDCERNQYVDPSTGLPPYIVTTAGTYQYSLPSTARKIIWVATQETSRGYDDYSLFRQYVWKGMNFYEVPVTSRPATYSAAASVTFRDDPGTQAELYHVLYYVRPTDIVSINIQIDVDEKWHDLVEDGCDARIKAIQYGNRDPWKEWQNAVEMDYWQEQNNNPTLNNLSPQRPC